MTITGRIAAFAVLGCATVAIAAGLAVGAAPAHAVPMVPLDPPPPANCAKFSFGGGFIRLIIPANNNAELNFASERSSSYHGPANFNGSPGTATGSINGRDFYLTWIRDNSANTVTFKGVVNPDGYASGTTTGTNGAPSQSWGSANALFCDDSAPPVQAPAPANVPCSDGSSVPAGQTCPVKPAVDTCPDGSTVPHGQACPVPVVTNAITLSFGNPGFGSLTATISNSSDLPGKCTYDATGVADTHRDFNVPAKGSTNLTFNGFNTGTTYHATVSCNDASGKQTQPIGSDSKDVKF